MGISPKVNVIDWVRIRLLRYRSSSPLPQDCEILFKIQVFHLQLEILGKNFLLEIEIKRRLKYKKKNLRGVKEPQRMKCD